MQNFSVRPSTAPLSKVHLFGTIFLILALFLSPGLALAEEAVTVKLEPMASSGVSGTATLSAAGDGTNAVLEVKGLAPNASARATMQAGTCATPSASFATLPDLKADANGSATATGSILFRGTENVALATIADGEHIIAIQSQGVVACGVIPKLTTLPRTGAPAPSLMFMLIGVFGLCAFAAGVFMLQRSRLMRCL